MPQMAPLSWLILFIVFCLTLLIFNSMNYFSFIYLTKSTQTKKSDQKINWKW